MWYIFVNEKCIGSCSAKPNLEDLETRGEVAIESADIIPINEVELLDSDVVRKETVQPTAEEIIEKQLAALDTEYQAQFTELAQALGLANLDNNTELIAELQEEYAELKAEYRVEREAIINGD